MLACLASTLAPDAPARLAERLATAAGGSLVENSDGSVRRRVKRTNKAYMSGSKPLPSDLALRLQAHRTAAGSYWAALEMLTPSGMDDDEVLHRAVRLVDAAHRWMDVAGDPVRIYVGNRVIRGAWWDWR